MTFDRIDLSKSKRFKDFNRAFYLSAEEVQAQEMAANKSDFLGGEPIVQAYEFDERLLQDGLLKVKVFDHYCLEWAEFVWNNRDENQNFHHDYDIVFGPIANDTIGLQMREFRRSHLTLEGFLEGIQYHHGETYQYAFCTEKAISNLHKL